MFLITKGERDRESFYLSTFSARIFFFFNGRVDLGCRKSII